MYVTSRNLRASSGSAMPQAINLVNYVVTLLNENHGGQFTSATQVGGDPSAIGVLGRYETLGDYERVMGGAAADTELQGAIQLGAHIFSNETADAIWNVRIPPGEPSTYSTVNASRILMSKVGEAMAYAAEVAATVSSITGNSVGLATAATGDRSRIVWIGYNSSMADMDGQTAALEADESYMDLFKRSEGLLVPNSLQGTIWRSTTA